MSRAVLVVAAMLATVLSAPSALGGGTDEAARRELTELKALCDAGLVAPPVCLEKQRVILGLPARDAAADAHRAPDGVSSEVATVYESPLGFRVALPPGWTALAPEQVAAGFDALRSRTDGNPDAARVMARLRAEDANANGAVFAKGRDSLQVTRTAAQPPADAAARAKLCERLEATTSKVAARRLRTYACGSRDVSGASAFYMERDALLPEARTIQVWLPARQGKGIQLVMTCRAADADERRREIEAIAESIRWE